MFSFAFVYLGALHRHKYHGMYRIDYTSILEYNDSNCKYFFHVLTMLLIRIIIIGSFFVVIGYGP